MPSPYVVGKPSLTEADVLEIGELLRQGVKMAQIAKRYGVTPPTIRNIAIGKTYGRITGISAKKPPK